MKNKYTPYLIGLGIFTLLFALFVELAVHEINPEDFSVPYYSSIEETETTTVLVSETATTTIPQTTVEETSETTTKASSKAVSQSISNHSRSVGTNIGQFRITVYTPSSDGGKWGYATATGVKSEHLQTCAVDPKVIPLGSVIEINGLRLKAVDVGGGVKGNIVDIFFDGSTSEAKEWISDFGEYHEVTFIE